MTISLPENSILNKKQFLYGVATASFQIEGGIEHRLPCIWDTFCATPGKIADGSDGSIACDHFNRWKDDIDLIESMGVDAYRLSISWPRVMHQDGTLNSQGIEFYINLLDELKARNIKAFVTLYHWDLPQYLEDQGGWLNRDTAYAFEQYVDLVTKALGDRVYSYATLNEPFCSAFLGYEIGVHAPGKVGKEFGKKAAHHLLLAHGLGMRVLQKNSPDSLNGIVLNFTPCYPLNDSAEDNKAADYADDYFNQWYIKPLFDKVYPAINEQLPADQQPEIHHGDMDIIAQPLDYLGINFYTRAVYKNCPDNVFEEVRLEDVERTDIGWEIYPKAFTKLLTDLHTRYSLPPIYITENGMAEADEVNQDGEVDDPRRVNYYNAHLNAVNDAVEAGVVVHGYFAWSLMDNFEWAEGYMKRFGVVHVDYDTQKRTIKSSGQSYRQHLLSRSE